MKRIRYSKYVPDPAGEMSMEDLLSALSDYLLQSGFQNYIIATFSMANKHSTTCAARWNRHCSNGNFLDEEMRERLLTDANGWHAG